MPIVCSRLLALGGLLILSVPASLRAADNALPNPGFEDGNTGWQIKESEPISQISGDAARTGSQGLRINDTSSDESANVMSERLFLDDRRNIRVTFWARTKDAPFVSVKLVYFDESNRWSTGDDGKVPGLSVTDASGEWVEYTFNCQVPLHVQSVALSIRSWSGTKGSLDLDDFELTLE